MNPVTRELTAAVGMLLLFMTVLVITETATRRGKLKAETARKTIHVAGGLGCLLFPFLISSWLTVFFLAMSLSFILYVGEKRKILKSLSSVERQSRGSLYFPVAILIIFVLSAGRIWFYIPALLVLVLADSAAAVVGTRYGRTFYQTGPNERKSLEGTVVFMCVGFLVVYIPLLLFSGLPHLTCILTALLMTLLLAALEAVSVGGTDNLFVPLVTSFLLIEITTKPQVEILFQCVSLFGISFLVFKANAPHKTLQTRSLIIFILTAYAAWALGSADWMIPILAGFILYNRLCAPCDPLPPELSAIELLRPLYPSLFILFTANATLELSFWFGPFLAAFATASSLCVANRFRIDVPPRRLRGARLAATAILPAAIPLLLCLPIQGRTILPAILVLVPLCVVITLSYNRLVRTPITPFAWNYAIPLCSAGGALTYAGLQSWGLVQLMEPSTWMEIFR